MDPILNKPLSEADPVLHDLLEKEKNRQWRGLELIASENFTSRAVFEANGSAATNKYSEGLPGRRYYGGNEFIDKIESLCQERALAAFHLDPKEWGVNVQPYSGSTANFATYTGIIKPHDRILALDLPAGGHLTHGYQTDTKKVSASSIYFESMGYSLTPEGYVDYDAIEVDARKFRPQLIICGGSAYPRDWDYKRLRSVATDRKALLMSDMAHISGLVAAEEQNNPFEYCDVVTTTTHKTLRGPRAGLIFFRKTKAGLPEESTGLEEAVNNAVFPGCQGGPHNNTISAVATALLQVNTPEFKVYIKQVKANCKALAETLVAHGYHLISGGTDNHLLLWDLKPQGLTGGKMEKLLEECSITVNKNTVVGDKSAFSPGGLRIGSPALTSRGFTEEDFRKIGDFLHRSVQCALDIQKRTGKKLTDFNKGMVGDAGLAAIRTDVEKFAMAFPMPGFEVDQLKYKE